MPIRPVEKIDDNVKIRNALISVFNKTGLEDFVVQLLDVVPSMIMYSTGGTYKKLRGWIGNDNLIEVSKYTGMPEIAGGVLKTLHHKIYLSLLTETYSQEHQQDIKRENAVPIDLVVCNLYPFLDVIKREGVTFEDARGNIDIGGPTMIRSAAKNSLRTAMMIDPNEYPMFLQELKSNNGFIDFDTRIELMRRIFRHTSNYDATIADYMENVPTADIRKCYEIVGGK